MGQDFLLSKDRLEIAPGKKVLKRREYADLVEAGDLLDAARKRVLELEEEGRAAFEEQKRLGFEAGIQEGKMEMATRMIESMARTVDSMGEMEEAVTRAVTRSLRVILGEMDDDELIRKVVTQALSKVRNQKRLTLRCSSKELETVRESMGSILKRYPEISFVDVVPDQRLEKGGCILESDMGVVDASLDKQIQAIESALNRKIKG